MKRYYCPDLPTTDCALLFGAGLALIFLLGMIAWMVQKILSYPFPLFPLLP